MFVNIWSDLLGEILMEDSRCFGLLDGDYQEKYITIKPHKHEKKIIDKDNVIQKIIIQ